MRRRFLVILSSIIVLSSFVLANENHPEGVFEPIPVTFEGVVLERLPAPIFWSGDIPSFQGVRYKVEKVIDGTIHEPEIVVYHSIVYDSPLCEKHVPMLSLSIFMMGNRLMVKAEHTPEGIYLCEDNLANVTVLNDN